MNSKQAAKFAFGNPGFFDFLAPIAKAISPTAQIIDIAKSITGVDVHQIARDYSPTIARALDVAETIQGGALAASGGVAGLALAAPALAGVSLPSVLPAIASQAQKAPALISNILGEETDTGSTQEDDAEDDSLGNDGDY